MSFCTVPRRWGHPGLREGDDCPWGSRSTTLHEFPFPHDCRVRHTVDNSSRAAHLAALEYAAGHDSMASWRTIAIARDRRQVWPGWLGWNAPTLTQGVGMVADRARAPVHYSSSGDRRIRGFGKPEDGRQVGAACDGKRIR